MVLEFAHALETAAQLSQQEGLQLTPLQASSRALTHRTFGGIE